MACETNSVSIAVSDDRVVPEWLNEDFIRQIIENENNTKNDNNNNNNNDNKISNGDEKCLIKIKSITNPCANGENYCSNLYRVAVEIQTHENVINQKQFMIKVILQEMNEVGHLSMYYNEKTLYDIIIPMFVNEWKIFGETVEFGPQYYNATVPDEDIITMEDLTARQYKVIDRFAGCDMKHAKLFYERLAKFHATSAVCYERYGNFPDKFHEKLLNDQGKIFFDMWIENTLPNLIAAMKTHPPLYKYIDKVKTWATKSFDKLKAITDYDVNEFNVLNHGDVWISNLLFAYDEYQNPIDVLFIDYQVPKYTTPALDILQFYISSMENELKITSFTELIQHYHEHLSCNLRKLDYPKHILSFHEFQSYLIRHGFLASINLISILPIAVFKTDKPVERNAMLFDDDKAMKVKRLMLNNPIYLKALEYAMEFLDTQGFLTL